MSEIPRITKEGYVYAGQTQLTIGELTDIYKEKQIISEAQPHASMTIPTGGRYGGTKEWELAFLCRVAHNLNLEHKHTDVIVEIGSLLGKSAIAMASVTHRKIICVDPHEGYWETAYLKYRNVRGVEDGDINRRDLVGNTLEQFTENVGHYGYADQIEPWVMMSDQAAKQWDGREICLLFIDGSHEYEDVRHDFQAWRPYLSPQAVVMFHDYDKTFTGVTTAVDEFEEAGDLQKLARVGSMMLTRFIDGMPSAAKYDNDINKADLVGP